MFFLVAIAVWTLMHVYVLARVRSIPAVAHRVLRWAMIVIGIALGSSYVVARVVEAVRFGAAAVVLEWIGAEWMGVLTIALGCFFVADRPKHSCFGRSLRCIRRLALKDFARP